jgi:hypothetical protein
VPKRHVEKTTAVFNNLKFPFSIIPIVGGMQRNWREYNEKLVRRGEFYISLDFLENWSEMNRGKVGRLFKFPETFLRFLTFLHIAKNYER